VVAGMAGAGGGQAFGVLHASIQDQSAWLWWPFCGIVKTTGWL